MRSANEEELLGSYWPGVADSLLAALMIVMLLAFGGLVLFALNPNSSQRQLIQLRQMLADLVKKNNYLDVENKQLHAEIDRLKKEKAPPIIELTDAQNVNFQRGKAEITPQFSTRLREHEFPRLRQIIDDYPTVDTIEIIGHTDNSVIASPRSNLDDKLSQVINGSMTVQILSAGSNADLGLMRAVAVNEQWRSWLFANHVTLPRPIDLRCYSAANGIPPVANEVLSKEDRDQKARRIEIRFTKLAKAAVGVRAPP